MEEESRVLARFIFISCVDQVLLFTEIETSRFGGEDNAQFLSYAWSIQADISNRQSESLRETYRLEIKI